ncbi:ankyrin repeat domain-containing protein [Novosphingobium lentum]|uniref:ankyrin repeat domain-containing protein n=1 Tax=Novosphingobium lentum TaxID=145287 RepID=UPI000AE7B237|nr:ankyrin repeat domain-containing protein [Novosphingobium lentum]
MIKRWRMTRGITVVRGALAARAALAALALVGGLALAIPAQAQFSDGYKFLEAVKKKDGQKVTDSLAEPGTTIVNTRDITTGDTAMHIVTQRRDAAWISFLAAHGANVNARNVRGVTPLVLACNLGFTDGVELLISLGARVDEPNDTGETPLIAAVHRRDGLVARMLLKAGANPNRPDNSGRSARDYATLDGHANPALSEIENAAKTGTAKTGKTYGPSL